jgi:hypothetical protein
MIIELALTIIIIIVVFTEFIKHTKLFSFATTYKNKKNIHDDCQYAKEAFHENDLYKRGVNDRYNLRYW